MKVDGITLLQMIRDEKIQPNTKIKALDKTSGEEMFICEVQKNYIYKYHDYMDTYDLMGYDFEIELIEESKLPVKFTSYFKNNYDFDKNNELSNDIAEIKQVIDSIIDYLLNKEMNK
jgi:CRISPR/Cas system endoribonuclease Cas6 (RAMP superfamily)